MGSETRRGIQYRRAELSEKEPGELIVQHWQLRPFNRINLYKVHSPAEV